MKRVISALVAILFLVSMPSFAINSKEISSSVEISKPDIIEKENYLRIEIEESEYFINPGKPIVPKIIKVFEIPFGAKNIKIDVFPKEISEINPGKELAISPYPTILSANEILPTNKKYEHEDTDYEIYPSSWYSYRIGCGLNDKMERVTFVTVHLFPVRYKPSESKIYFASNFEIKIRYDKPSKLTSSSSYDLVIISPKE
ncbi:MAG: hypothetical protein H5T44_04805, partial [Thermoplasmatales archaeon]|nr:hypothetical protein [Thermoplasmatales archaeon]